MRPLLHGDLASAARLLLTVPPAARGDLCRQLLAEAEAADAHRRATGKLHPRWGNGSLMAAARKRPLPPEPGFDDGDYCHAFATVLRMLAAHRRAARGQGAAKATRG